MTEMRLALRSPLATLVPLLLLVATAAVAGGCSPGDDVGAGGPTVTATGPSEPTTDPTGRTSGTTDEATDGATDGATDTWTEQPAAVAAVCGPYIEMARAIKNAAFAGASRQEIAAAITPRLKEFASRVPDLERPPGVSAATWSGVEALAERILALPDDPTTAEVAAVESQLSEKERAAFHDGARWLRTNCHL
jgi:hypothetical protein